MKKTIFTAILLSAALALAIGSCATSGNNSASSSKNEEDVAKMVWQSSWYAYEFELYRQQNSGQQSRFSETGYRGGKSSPSPGLSHSYGAPTESPYMVRYERGGSSPSDPNPREQSIDLAIGGYEFALKQWPKKERIQARVRGGSGTDYTSQPNVIDVDITKSQVQSLLESARNAKQQWLVEKEQKEQQLAAAQQAAQQAEQEKQQAQASERARAYVNLFSVYAGTVLVNGQPTQFTARANTDIEVTIENASGQYTFAVRDSGGTARQAIAAITVSATGPNNKYRAIVLDPNPPVNGPDDFDVAQNTDGGVTITGYKGTRKQVVIPDTLYGMRVTGIGGGAFFRKGIYSVVIPNTVTIIAEGDTSLLNPDKYGAFSRNPLVKVTLGNGLKTIGSFAFYGNSLTELTIPDTVTEIGFAAFYEGDIAKITFGRGLRTIRAFAFYKNKLESLSIPNGVTLIERGAFAYNPITTLVIPESLAVLSAERGIAPGFAGGASAFEETPLTRVTLPANFDPKNYDIGIDYNLINYYKSQGSRAGTFVKNGPVWVRQ